VHLGRRDDGGEAAQELSRGERDGPGAVVHGALEGELEPTVGEAAEPVLGHGRPEHVAQEVLEGLAVAGGDVSAGLEREALDEARELVRRGRGGDGQAGLQRVGLDAREGVVGLVVEQAAAAGEGEGLVRDAHDHRLEVLAGGSSQLAEPHR